MASNLAPNSAAAENVVFDTVGDDDQIFPIPIRRRALQRAAKELRAHSADEDGSATQQGQEGSSTTDVLRFPAMRTAAVAKRAESFLALQEWEGYVVRVRSDSFVASLRDVTAGATVEEEEAEFPCEDISEGDRALLREGAIFRWVVGYQTKGGTRRRVSEIVFRHLPRWSNTEIDHAFCDAEHLAREIKWE